MKEEMTINKFLVQLRKTKGLGWEVDHRGGIRSRRMEVSSRCFRCCPITAVCGEKPAIFYHSCSISLGISLANARLIVAAADSPKAERNKKLRKRILKAVGL